jgi:hypothetical protein
MEWNEALQDLNRAVALQPNEPALQTELKRIKQQASLYPRQSSASLLAAFMAQRYSDPVRARRFSEMLEMDRAAQEARETPSPTQEDLLRAAQVRKPDRLRPTEFDPITGRVQWPAVLLGSAYDEVRTELDEVLHERAVKGEMDAATRQKSLELAKRMREELRAHVKEMPPDDYVAARRFIESLVDEMLQGSSVGSVATQTEMEVAPRGDAASADPFGPTTQWEQEIEQYTDQLE